MFTTKSRIFAAITLTASLWLVACSPQPEVVQPADPAWTNAAAAKMQLESGALTSVDLVQHYLDAIAANNQHGYEIRAIIDVNPDALTIAAERDRERAAGQIRGQLHGLPVILKANIATADSLPTTAGAEVMQGFVTEVDAELVQQLRDEGAIILAKANLSEWANFRGQNSISGWSGLGGQTRNPHVLTHNPCGSSSGSGAAIAADFALLAVGTETDGSIMCPASINGVVGIKPTRGTVSGHGIIPIASAQDIAGPMTRYVYDAALLLDAMITPDAADRFGVSLARASQTPYSGEPVLLVRAWDERFQGVKELTDRTVTVLRAQGIEVIEVHEWQLPSELGQAEIEVLIYEFQRDLNAWLEEFAAPEQARDMNAIIAYNQAHAERTLALFGQEYFEAAAAVDLAEAEESYLRALSTSRELAEAHLDQYLKDLGVAAIIMPSYGPAWPIPPVEGPGYSFGTSTAAAVAGYPAINVPSGREDVRPIGLSLVGLPYSEPQLLSLAALIEDVVGGFQRPQFLPELPATEKE